MIDISVEKLEELEACSEGIEAFAACFPNGLKLPGWGNINQMMLLGTPELRPYFGWAVENRLIPSWSMRSADLSRADLSRADLSRTDLRDAIGVNP